MKKWQELLIHCGEKYPLIAFTIDMVEVFLDRRVSRSAAELSYYLLLTLFPMLIMVIGIVGMLPITEEQAVRFISEVLPQSTTQLVVDYLTYVQAHRGIGMFTAGLITTITAASAAFRGLVSISGEIYGRKAFRGVWHIIFSFLFSVLLLVMIYLSLLVILTGSWFMKFLRSTFSFIKIPVYWPFVRLVLMFAVAMLFLTLLYWVTAPKGRARPPAVTGACLTAFLLTLSSSLFSALISLSSRYSLIYGSLASVIILMVWLYLCGNIVIVGNVFNYVLWRRKRGLPVAFILEKKL